MTRTNVVVSISTGGNAVTFSTDDHATDPNANALEYQTLYNLRFEADRAPTAANATVGIFRPGTGTSFTAATQAPGSAVDVPVVAGAGGLQLAVRGANPSARGFELEFALPAADHAALTVRDVTGRRVRELASGPAAAGLTTVTWDGRDELGAPAASGVYFFRLETPNGTRTVKGTLLR